MLCALMSVTFTSCGDDDDDNEPTSTNNLIGKWKATDSDGSWEIWEFNTNGYLTITSYDGEKDYYNGVSTNNTYTVTGNQLRVDFGIEGGIADDYTLGTYSINGDMLTYIFTWHDGNGEWDRDELETYIFTKVK